MVHFYMSTNDFSVKNLEPKNSSQLIVKRNLNVGEQYFAHAKSSAKVDGDLTAKALITNNGSKIVVGGTLKIERLDLKNKSTICVAGDLDIKEVVKGQGTVYYMGIIKRSNDASFKKKDNNFFAKECGMEIKNSSEWEKTIDVEYLDLDEIN